MRVSITADTARMERTLSAVGIRAIGRLQDAVMDAVLAIHGDARRRCPVDTGRLRNSLGWETEPSGLAATVGTNVSYAKPVEYGGLHTPAQPYLTPSFYAELPRFEGRLQRALNAAANDAARAR